jgi:HD-GYP domain-containing protein (c-di-GMP phosphodiesterase class II)
VFDALTSERPYRTALTAEAAGRYLLGEVAKNKFARKFVEAFLDTLAIVNMPTVH